ncbi:putative SET domain, CXC domain, pre-SET CXC domain-containing protein [Plasmopara halstedii]
MSRKRPCDLEEMYASEPSESEMEEQQCAQAAEAFNQFIRSHQIAASTEVARNRVKGSLYIIEQRRRRIQFPVLPNVAALEALQGSRVQTSELPLEPDPHLQRLVSFNVVNPNLTAYKKAVMLPKVPPIPTATMWTALTKNYEVEDEPTLKFPSSSGDGEAEDFVAEFYRNKQQRTSACEMEFTKELCKGVLETLQSTWDLTPSDLKRVAQVICVEEEVLVEVHKKMCQSQSRTKKKRRSGAITSINLKTVPTSTEGRAENGVLDLSSQSSLSMKECFKLYEQLVDSYRSLFCRRCCVYDCDYHGCTEQPKLKIAEQNAVARNAKEKKTMVNKRSNCGNRCFFGRTDSSNHKVSTEASAISSTVGWGQPLRILCARIYNICLGNFCKMAKLLGNKSCMEVADMCANYDFHDSTSPKEIRPRLRNRHSRKRKISRMSMFHLQNAKNGVVNSVQIKIEPCSHVGYCEPGVCSCVEKGIFCSKHCHCIHDECKIFFLGCQCLRGRCRTKACPCYCSGRECDIDLCKLCCADEIAAREKGESYDWKLGRKDSKHVSCQNRSIALSKEKHVRLGRSKLNNSVWGLFVEDFVAKDEFIIEYIGEMISQEEADRRGTIYDKADRSYLFNLDTKTVIDSTRKGNKTRYINHSSSNPNCACKIVNVSSDFRIGLYAIHDIQPHTELFFDYGYDKQQKL